MEHPEQIFDEVFLGNFTLDGFYKIAWNTARRGKGAYDIYGNVINYGTYPVFVGRKEMNDIGFQIYDGDFNIVGIKQNDKQDEETNDVVYFGHKLKVPKGFDYLTTDIQGDIKAFKNEPVFRNIHWWCNEISNRSDFRFIAKCKLVGDCEGSLVNVGE
jgi:hypothetical protein